MNKYSSFLKMKTTLTVTWVSIKWVQVDIPRGSRCKHYMRQTVKKEDQITVGALA